MSIIGWVMTVGGAVIGTAFFEIVFHLIVDELPYQIYYIYHRLVVHGGRKGIKPRVHPKVDFGYQSRIRWWEYVKKCF